MRILTPPLHFVSLVAISVSCSSVNTTQSSKQDSIELVGNDRDSNDCIASAGYTWSKIKQTCVRPWEDGIELRNLNTSSAYQTSAYILVDSTKNDAEIFIPNESHSIVLQKNSANHYTNGTFNLTQENFCWTLSLNNTKLYQEQQ
ncbi:hypothetical protein FAZ15_19150 [Sphingobacterium olei]|uniref:Lipoprotein n=1 Tax=Sphingobacterium olei TaxID=2571155 RepID=A0A4V5MLB8_9SPHI|nr:hypothetical protein [Sphingobacterium olei]TJZ52508.1 hypothetical protein FAZ15_19150 [Sphingobacterium olei]